MYNLEIPRIIKEIKKNKARLVCIQLPDGLKPKATCIASEIEKNTDATCLIYADSCYGICDLPNLERIKPDLLIHFGHSSKIIPKIQKC